MTRYNFSCGKFSKNFKLSGLAIASLLLIFSPWITFLTASSTILPLFVLGISGTFIIIAGTCFGEQFFLILDLINFIKEDNKYLSLVLTPGTPIKKAVRTEFK